MVLELSAYIRGLRQTWKLADSTCIGRREDLPLCLPDRSVSRVHAVVRKQDDAVTIEDLSSHNGTFVNGVRLHGPRRLRPGDKITIGKFVLRLEDSEVASEWETHSLQGSLGARWSFDGSTLTPEAEGPSRLYRLLMHLGEFLVSTHTQEEVDVETLRVLEKLLPYRRAFMLRLDAVGNPVVAAARSSTEELHEPMEIRWEGVEAAMRRGKPLLVGLGGLLDPRARDAASAGPAVAVVPLRTEDELVGALYLESFEPGGYTAKDLRRLGFVANLLAMKTSNARLSVVRDEVRTAACIQRALLCKEPRFPRDYEAGTRLVSSTAMSGDLYETSQLPQGQYLYALGDVVGHGVGAALLMANVLAAIRALALAEQDALALVLRLHEQTISCVDETSYVTLFLAVLDPREHRLSYVNAGHEPPALFERAGPVRRLEPTGPALGMRLDIPFESRAVEMRPGSLLCVWSDGLTEAYSDRRSPPEFFGDERLLEVMSALHPAPIDTIVQQVFAAVDRWLGGSRAKDDRTLLLLRRRAELEEEP